MRPIVPRAAMPGVPVNILVADTLAESGVAALRIHHSVDDKTGLSKE